MESIPKEPVADSPIAQWQEPKREAIKLTGTTRLYVMIAAVLLFAGLIYLGYWQKSFSYYLGAVVVATGATALLMQGKHAEKPRQISLSRQWLTVDGKQYAIQDLAGFWLERDNEHLVINVETKKPTLVPISFFYPALNTNEARSVLTQVLAEVEPRFDHTSGVNRYFRF